MNDVEKLRLAFLELAEVLRDHLREGEENSAYIAIGTEPSDRITSLMRMFQDPHTA